MSQLKCVTAWEADLCGALIKVVALVWLIWYITEQNITLTTEHHSVTSGQWEYPGDDEWDLFTLLASQWSAIFRSSSLLDVETGMKTLQKLPPVIEAFTFCALQIHRCCRCMSDDWKHNAFFFLCYNMWVGESLEMSIWENKAVISNTNTEKYEETVVVHWKHV